MASNPDAEDIQRASEYWKEQGRELDRDYVVEPQPQPGLLSADRIREYCRRFQMIDPFTENNLKPASYSLTLGPIYQVEGQDGTLTRRSPTLTIPPNAMAFVSMNERLRLPHYVAARFNLAIDLIYVGLLLGTGPQVDPGFQGVLSCPLYNLSNVPIRLMLGQHISTIDFETTTGLPAAVKNDGTIQGDKDLYAAAARIGDLNIFSATKRWLRPVLGYPPGRSQFRSSVSDAVEDVRRLRNQLRIGALAAVVAGIAVGASILGVLAALAIGYWQVATDNTSLRSRLNSVEATQAAQSEQDQKRLQACAQALLAVAPASPSPGPTLPPECQPRP